MREFRTEIEINATPDQVWDTLMDYDSYPDWNPFVQSASGNQVPGETLQIYIKPPKGMGMTIKPKVRKVEPGKEFRWKGKMFIPGLFDGEHIFELRAIDGGCHFTQREEFTGILVTIMLRLIGKKTLRGFNEMNAALKQRVESANSDAT